MANDKIVLKTPVVKYSGLPANVKQQDSILEKKYWSQGEVDLLVEILDYYDRTYYTPGLQEQEERDRVLE